MPPINTSIDFNMTGTIMNTYDIVPDPLNYFYSFFNDSQRDGRVIKEYILSLIEAIKCQNLDNDNIMFMLQSELDRITSDLVLKELSKDY